MTNGLHKSKIDYIAESECIINRPGYVLNIVTGCKHYMTDICRVPCYAEYLVNHGRLKGSVAYPYGFEPTFHPERVVAIGGKPKLIFLNDMGDVGGDWEWASVTRRLDKQAFFSSQDIASEMVRFATLNPQHILLLLTKNPSFYGLAEWPANVWCGVTVTNPDEYGRIGILSRADCKHHWISFEPWLTDEHPIDELMPDTWLVIGGLSGKVKRPVSEATLDWLMDKTVQAKRFTKLNAVPLHDMILAMPREYPESGGKYGNAPN